MNLHEAAEQGDMTALTAALDAGANINEQDHNGETFLLAALMNDHVEVARMLIDRGANLTLQNLGGSNAWDTAFDAPEIRAILEERGVSSAYMDVTKPYDPAGGFPDLLGDALAKFRGSRFLKAPHVDIMGLIVDDMPADLKALLHTFAHTHRSNYLELGAWDVASRSLDRAKRWAHHGGAIATIDLTRTVQIGCDPGGIPLLATWTEGAEEMRIYQFDHEYDELTDIGSLPALFHAAEERLGEQGEPLTDDLRELLGLEDEDEDEDY